MTPASKPLSVFVLCFAFRALAAPDAGTAALRPVDAGTTRAAAPTADAGSAARALTADAGTSSSIATTPDAGTSGTVTLVGAGDIAVCGSDDDEATAKLLDKLPGTVFTLGDNAYTYGTREEFARCYEPTWGRHKGRTRPVPGNHDFATPGAKGYFDYFGAAAGEGPSGYYSYRAGEWLVVVLNSNCKDVPGGCDKGSPQERWLKRELAQNPTRCTLAMWHHPLFSSGVHGSAPLMTPLFDTLYQHGADLVLTGHDHHYERMAPMDPKGRRDPERGIRQFIVGTGGVGLRRLLWGRLGITEVRDSFTHGVLELKLRPDSYSWRFIPTPGGEFSDSGSSRCH